MTQNGRDRGTVVFDLDGTLADTAGDLIAAANACLAARGLGRPLDPVADAGIAFHGGRAMLRAGYARAPAEMLLPPGAEDEDFPLLLDHYGNCLADTTRLYPGTEAALEALAAAGIELVFSFLLGALTSFRITVFMIGLAFGKSVTWGGQQRDAMALSWREAWDAFWPQMAFGWTVFLLLWLASPAAALWSLPLTAGFLVAVPFAVVTASPALGRLFVRHRICAIPEEFETPREIEALGSAA